MAQPASDGGRHGDGAGAPGPAADGPLGTSAPVPTERCVPLGTLGPDCQPAGTWLATAVSTQVDNEHCDRFFAGYAMVEVRVSAGQLCVAHASALTFDAATCTLDATVVDENMVVTGSSRVTARLVQGAPAHVEGTLSWSGGSVCTGRSDGSLTRIAMLDAALAPVERRACVRQERVCAQDGRWQIELVGAASAGGNHTSCRDDLATLPWWITTSRADGWLCVSAVDALAPGITASGACSLELSFDTRTNESAMLQAFLSGRPRPPSWRSVLRRVNLTIDPSGAGAGDLRLTRESGDGICWVTGDARLVRAL